MKIVLSTWEYVRSYVETERKTLEKHVKTALQTLAYVLQILFVEMGKKMLVKAVQVVLQISVRVISFVPTVKKIREKHVKVVRKICEHVLPNSVVMGKKIQVKRATHAHKMQVPVRRKNYVEMV